MSNRNVRLGIVYRGSIVREEILDRRIDVSVGQRADSTLQFSPREHPDFPEHVDVLLCEKNVYYLVVPSDPNARINLRGASNADKVETIRGKRCIPIDDVAGGSVVVGDLSVMFQFVRGYTTPTAVHEKTVLRIGLVYNERLISDRVYAKKGVSIGGQKSDAVVLDQDDYKGPTLNFVNNSDGSVTMKAPADMNIRAAVKEGEAPRDLTELIKGGHARSEGSVTACHLALGTRGRAIMGPYTVLFQVVRQRVVVPSMAKKTLLQTVLSVFLGDVVWTSCFAVAFLLGGGVVVQALLFQGHTGQYLKKAEEEKHVSQIYEVLVEEKEVVPEPEPEPENIAPIVAKEEPKEEEKAKPKEAAPAKKEEKPQSTGKTVDPAERKRHAREVVSQKTIAGAFMDAGGASTKLFADGGEGGEGSVQAKTFGGGDDGAEGQNPGGALKLKGGGGGGTVEKIKGGKGGGFGKRKKNLTAVKAKKKEATVKVKLSTPELGGSGAGKAGVAKVIARKNSAVRRCYEAALRDDPGLSGKVKVRFTVGTAGTVTSVSVLGASGGFSSCIKGKFSRIRGLPLLPAPQSFTQSYVFTKS